MASTFHRSVLRLTLAPTLALALALVLTAVPFNPMSASARNPSDGGAGMSTLPLLILDGTVRVATATTGGSGNRLHLVDVPSNLSVTRAPRLLRWHLWVALPPAPVERMIALGRMQDDGG